MNRKPYLNLEAAASLLDCTPEDIIYLGTQGVIPIYVLPKGWRADYYTYIDDEASDNHPDTEPTNPEKFWPVDQNFEQTELLSPVRLHQYTLAVLGADADTATKYFFSPNHAEKNKFEELRVHSDSEGKSLDKVSLKNCTLVVMEVDIKKYLNSLPKKTSGFSGNTAQIGETLQNTLLKQIGILAILLSNKANKYKVGEKVNAKVIAEDVDTFLKNFKNDLNEQTLNTHGLSRSNIRKNVSSGIKLLHKI